MAATQLAAAHPWSPNSEQRAFSVMEVGAGVVIYQGADVAVDTGSTATKGYLVPYTATTGLKFRGRARTTVDNTNGANGAVTVEVDFIKPIHLLWMDNVASANACAKADRGSPVYGESDHEGGKTSSGLSQIGTLFDLGTSLENSAGLIAVEI